MRIVEWSIAVAFLLPTPTQTGSTGLAPVNRPCLVRGRIEISNPKIRLRGGGTDASGVAVWLTSSQPEARPEPAPLPRARIEQRDKRFVPHITVIEVGTEIDFPNRDPFFHNVFSTFDGKIFDLGLYASGESRAVRFNRPGVSFLYCNIHPQMSAVIVTVDTPYFAESAQDGAFSIRDVPAGSYELRVWHERCDQSQLDAQRRTVTVEPPAADVGVIRLDEAAYIPTGHKNKHGEEYPEDRGPQLYRRP